MRLGDRIEAALALAGVRSERIERWLGRPCGCAERRERLNALGAWAARVIGGKTDRALEFLDRIAGVRDDRE